MTRDDVKKAADALGRLEALEAALKSANAAPHEALPISFFDMGTPPGATDNDAGYVSDHGIKAYYPKTTYCRVIDTLIRQERKALTDVYGVDLDA